MEMQPRSSRPRFWIAIQPSIVRVYKVAGLIALTAILVGLVGFLIVNIYYFFDHTWVRPVVLSGQLIPSSNGTAIANATGTDFGNVGRNVLRGPAQVNFDLSVIKRFHLREFANLEFRAEAFNVLNHTNFGLPNQIVFQGNPATYSFSDSAGQITSTANYSRQLQFALKLPF